MLKIPARSKLINLHNSVKLYYVLAIGAFITVLTFLLYKDFIVSATMLISTIGAFIILGRPSVSFALEIDSQSILINGEKLYWSSCTAWALTDLNQSVEFAIQTTQFSQQFYYFYLDVEQPGLSELIEVMTNYLPYSEEVANANIFHTLLRIIGLR